MFTLYLAQNASGCRLKSCLTGVPLSDLLPTISTGILESPVKYFWKKYLDGQRTYW